MAAGGIWERVGGALGERRSDISVPVPTAPWHHIENLDLFFSRISFVSLCGNPGTFSLSLSQAHDEKQVQEAWRKRGGGALILEGGSELVLRLKESAEIMIVKNNDAPHLPREPLPARTWQHSFIRKLSKGDPSV